MPEIICPEKDWTLPSTFNIFFPPLVFPLTESQGERYQMFIHSPPHMASSESAMLQTWKAASGSGCLPPGSSVCFPIGRLKSPSLPACQGKQSLHLITNPNHISHNTLILLLLPEHAAVGCVGDWGGLESRDWKSVCLFTRYYLSRKSCRCLHPGVWVLVCCNFSSYKPLLRESLCLILDFMTQIWLHSQKYKL